MLSGENMEYKLAVAVRNDLKLSKGKLAVQVAHASVICALKMRNENMKWFKSWYDEGQRKIVVKAENLEMLYELKSTAEKKKLTTSLVEDAGLTEVPPGTITCLGIGPGPENIVDEVTGKLALL